MQQINLASRAVTSRLAPKTCLRACSVVGDGISCKVMWLVTSATVAIAGRWWEANGARANKSRMLTSGLMGLLTGPHLVVSVSLAFPGSVPKTSQNVPDFVF